MDISDKLKIRTENMPHKDFDRITELIRNLPLSVKEADLTKEDGMIVDLVGWKRDWFVMGPEMRPVDYLGVEGLNASKYSSGLDTLNLYRAGMEKLNLCDDVTHSGFFVESKDEDKTRLYFRTTPFSLDC